jgi:AcrR family transcriptional regulator
METTTRRRTRDPAATRETILEAAASLLAKDGMEGISLSAVAHLAAVNRGTAYQHFATREKLIEATLEWVSARMHRAVFGKGINGDAAPVKDADVTGLTDRLAAFAMESPELCRVWLQQVLASPDPSQDAFWREYSGRFARFAATGQAEAGIDVEAVSVTNLAGMFFWPIFVRAHAASSKERGELTRRYAQEVLRFSLYGTMRAEAFPEIVERVKAKAEGAG